MPVGPKPVTPKLPHLPSPIALPTEFHEVFPKSEGPPPVPAGGSRAAYSPKGERITVVMDRGAFRTLWEMTESAGKKAWPDRNDQLSAAATLRALKQLREAWSRYCASQTQQ